MGKIFFSGYQKLLCNTAQHIASLKVKVPARRALPALNPVLMRARHSMKYHASAEMQLVKIIRLTTSQHRDSSCRYFLMVYIVMNVPGTLAYPCKNPLAGIGRVRHTGLQGGQVPLPPIVRSWPELLSMPSPHFQRLLLTKYQTPPLTLDSFFPLPRNTPASYTSIGRITTLFFE